jgi:hypothetical protein
MSQTINNCTFCGAALTPGKGVCDFCGAPVEDSPGLTMPPVSPFQPDKETLIDDSPPITSVEPQPEPFMVSPASYPEASPFEAAQASASSTRSRPVWVWVLVAVLAVIIICLCIGVIGGLALFQ